MTNYMYEDNHLKVLRTTFKGTFEEDGQICAHTEDNIFYPHGGGQKGDRGELVFEDGIILKVLDTIKDRYSASNGVNLIVDRELDEYRGQLVECRLDWDFRYAQMKLHTCVHLHHCVIEKTLGRKLPYPKTSNIEDGFAYNRYEGEVFSKDEFEKSLPEFLALLKTPEPVKTYPDPTPEKADFRWWECMGYKIPCGGVHVSTLDEIGDIDVSYSNKKGCTTVKFSLK